MTYLSRAAMQGLPRILQAELQQLDEAHDATAETAASADAKADTAQTTAQDAASQENQPFSALLEAIAALPSSQTGFLAVIGTNSVDLIPGSALARFLGKGPTSGRPTSPSPGMYFDTTLAANGKPIFWTSTGWVDATGTAV